jgi:carbamoyltransferase
MEFGSRALGHRSFVCDPSNLKTKERLNDLIKQRDFWMPFTPSIISEDFSKYVKGKSKYCNSYMTLSFETTELARKNLIAAIHPKDLTIRPQKVTKQTCPRYYKLIKKFKKYSGIGAVLNTSLNIHEKPIIMDPKDIIKDFILTKNIFIDNIYVHDTLFTLKKLIIKKDKII